MAIVDGSQMDRDCKTCKRNKGDQEYYSCGYISKDRRRGKPDDFPATKDSTLTVDICKVYYYNRYEYLYKWFNIERRNNTYLRDMTFGERALFTEFQHYLNLKQEYLLKKAKKRSENE